MEPTLARTGRKATPVFLHEEDEATLKAWLRAGKTEVRHQERARIILAAASGMSNLQIAEELHTRKARVSQWRTRYAKMGIQGLADAPRPGRSVLYGIEAEKRILTQLDAPPPKGYSAWNGKLLAQALTDIPPDQVWRVLRRHGIQLQRRRSWCISTDPQFAQKAADVVGFYLDPPDGAVVLSVDEKPSIQALERAQGFLRLPNGKALVGFSHEYKRHGTTTLFAALNVATGLVKAGHFQRKSRREFLLFMNEVIRDYPGKEIHVILDNFSTHKPKIDLWSVAHPEVRFHYTPTHASWLNQVEIWFSILTRSALRRSFTSTKQVVQAIDDFIAVYNQHATPFEWKKRLVHPSKPKVRYGDLCK